MIGTRKWYLFLMAATCLNLAPAASEELDMALVGAIRAHNPSISPERESYIYNLHKKDPIFARYDANYNGIIEYEEWASKEAAPKKRNTTRQSVELQNLAKPNPAKPTPMKPSPAETVEPHSSSGDDSAKDKRKKNSACPQGTGGDTVFWQSPDGNTVITPLIRRNFADVFLFNCPSTTLAAEGADFAVSVDRISHNTTWSVNGMAAVAYQYFGQAQGLVGFSIAPYVQIEKLSNADRKLESKNTEVVSGGGSAEIGWGDIGGGWQHYFRFHAGVVSDNAADTTSVKLVGEWIPVSCATELNPIPFGISCRNTLVGPLAYRISPELKVQYDEITGGVEPLAFSGRNRALRIGPQVKFEIWSPYSERIITGRYGLSEEVASIVKSLSFNLTYHWAEEIYSNRGISWLETALMYNIDPAGHFAIKGSYQKGYSELTGMKTNLYTASLSVKY